MFGNPNREWTQMNANFSTKAAATGRSYSSVDAGGDRVKKWNAPSRHV